MENRISKKFTISSLVFILALSFLLPFFSVAIHSTFTYDEGISIYNSYLELQGKRVYKDYFNVMQKPPGIVFILKPIIALFGNSFTSLLASRIFMLILKTITAFIVYLIALKLSSQRIVALLSALLFSISSIGNSVAGVVFTEPASVLFLSCAYLFSLMKFRQKYYLVGFAVGLSGLFRQTPIFFAIIMGFAILLIEKRRRMRSIANYVLGGVIGFSPMLIYIIHQNVLDVFFKAIFLFNRFHPMVVEGLSERFSTLLRYFRYDIILLLLFVLSILHLTFRRRMDPKLRVQYEKSFFVYAWLAAYLLPPFIGRLFPYHYLYELLVPLCLLAGRTLFIVYHSTYKLLPQKMKAALISTFCFLLIISILFSFFPPLIALDDFDKELYYCFEKYHPKSILTDEGQFIFLFNLTDYLYWGASQEYAYKKSGLEENLGFRDQNLSSIIQKETFDIIYLNYYSHENEAIVIPKEKYVQFSLKEKKKGLRAFVKKLFLRGENSRYACEPITHFYYVRKELLIP